MNALEVVLVDKAFDPGASVGGSGYLGRAPSPEAKSRNFA
jgi:hypothetical protein